MDRVIGGILGLGAFTAVTVLGSTKSLGVTETLWRAGVAGGCGYLVGRVLLGKIGARWAKEAAGESERGSRFESRELFEEGEEMASVTKRPKEEIARLWEDFQRTRDVGIKNILSEEYLPIVRYVAEKTIERLPHNVQIEDLTSVGTFGLFDAIEKFDLKRGVKFETYCVNRIRGAILDELRAMDWVPRLTRARANRLEEAHTKLERELGRGPTDVELARELKISLEGLDELYREVSGASVLSLHKRTLEKEENTVGVDVMEDAKIRGPFTESQRRDLIGFCQRSLSTKERYILMMYYFEDLTLKEIGMILGLSESRVCQLHAKLISRLKSYLRRRSAEAV